MVGTVLSLNRIPEWLPTGGSEKNSVARHHTGDHCKVNRRITNGLPGGKLLHDDKTEHWTGCVVINPLNQTNTDVFRPP